jgi:hypothetical protein
MKDVFKKLAGRVSDTVENMMDRVNPERIHLDCGGITVQASGDMAKEEVACSP